MGSRPWRTSSLAADCPARVGRSRSFATAPALDRFRLPGYQLGRFTAGGRVRALGLEPRRVARWQNCGVVRHYRARNRHRPSVPAVRYARRRSGIAGASSGRASVDTLGHLSINTRGTGRCTRSTHVGRHAVLRTFAAVDAAARHTRRRGARKPVARSFRFSMGKSAAAVPDAARVPEPALTIPSVRQLLRAQPWFREGASIAAARSVATRRTRGSRHRRTAIPI